MCKTVSEIIPKVFKLLKLLVGLGKHARKIPTSSFECLACIPVDLCSVTQVNSLRCGFRDALRRCDVKSSVFDFFSPHCCIV